MRAIAAGVTDVGKERDHNEDRFVLLPEFEVFVVADGMGGHQCGEVASRMATSTIASYFRAHRGNRSNGVTIEILRAALVEANERIHRRAMGSTIHRGMGTTVVAAAYSRTEQRLYIAHAGDSRAYRLREGQFEQLTRDHSLVEEALRTRPDITQSELAYLPGNVITRALGVENTVDIEVTVERVKLGDMFLLCSDGLHGFVPDDRISAIVREMTVLTSACAELIAEANKNGGGDNITAVLIRMEELDEPWAVSTTIPPAPGKVASRRPRSMQDPDTTTELGPTSAPDPYESTAKLKQKDIDEGVALARRRRATRRDHPASGSSPEGAPESIETDDTARFAAVTDPDSVLANAETGDGGDEG